MILLYISETMVVEKDNMLQKFRDIDNSKVTYKCVSLARSPYHLQGMSLHLMPFQIGKQS
jgi:hypothetical protein